MKTTERKFAGRLALRQRGFTLIELLAVVAIVLLLVSLLLPAINAVRKSAQRTRAHGDVATLTHGLKQYFSEYQRWPTNLVGGDTGPDIEATVPVDSGLEARSNLLAMLGGQDIKDNNPRRKQFLEVPPQAVNTDGSFTDPWGNPYKYMCDFDYSGSTGIKFTSGTSNVTDVAVCVWSRGPDKSDEDGKRADDIASWQ